MSSSDYIPQYVWFDTTADLVAYYATPQTTYILKDIRSSYIPPSTAGEPALVSSDDRVENQVLEGTFTYGRFGGCLAGSLTTAREMATLVRKGWWVLVYMNPEQDPVWVGRVFDEPVQGENTGTINLRGPIHYFNGYMRQVPVIDNLPIETGIYDMAKEMEKVNRATEGLFVPEDIYTGHYNGWDPKGQDFITTQPTTLRAFQMEAATVAGFADNIFYGFFPSSRKIWISEADFDADLHAEPPTATPLDFQIGRGQPGRLRFFQDKKNVNITTQRSSPEERFNRVVLTGTRRDHIWVAQDTEALKTEPPMTKWGRRVEIGEDALGQRIADGILKLGTQSTEFYDVDIIHDETVGATTNLVESPLFPWIERPVIKDKFGVRVITEGIIEGSVLKLGKVPSQTIQMGRSNVDIKTFFGLDRFDNSPSRDSFAFPGVMPWEPGENHRGPSDITDPPVGLFFRPIHRTEDSRTEALKHVIPSSLYRYTNFGIIDTEFTGTHEGVNYHILRTKSDRFSTTTWNPAYPYRLGALDQLDLRRQFRWADPMTIPFWMDFTNQTWEALASIYEGDDVVQWEDLLKQASSFLWTNYRIQNQSIDSLVEKLRYGQITSSDIRRLQRSESPLFTGYDQQGYIVDPNPGDTDTPADGWVPLNAESDRNYEDLHFVPYSLIMHLGGSMRGLITGAEVAPYVDSDHPNWDYLLAVYGGQGNIYSVESTWLPYEVTVAVPAPLPRDHVHFVATEILSNDATSEEKNIFYFTEEGAAEAKNLGYFYHECMRWITDFTDWDDDDSPELDAHNMGRFGIFTERKTTPEGIDYDEYVNVPLDMRRLLTAYDVHEHPVLGPFTGELPRLYSGPDGYGSLMTKAHEMPNEASRERKADKSYTSPVTGQFINPDTDDIKITRKKITITNIEAAPPSIYKGDSDVTTYPPPQHMRSWKVRGYDDDHANKYS